MTQASSIDLHVHSTCSDGTCTPTQLVKYAIKKGLQAIAITDHDTTEGIHEATLAAHGTSLKIIPGIELSTAYSRKDIHILGLNFDPENIYFQEKLFQSDTYSSQNAFSCSQVSALEQSATPTV